MIKLQELKRLDKVSLAEIEKIIEEYEEIRMKINRELNAGKTPEEIEAEQNARFLILEPFHTKFLSILEQMKTENYGG